VNQFVLNQGKYIFCLFFNNFVFFIFAAVMTDEQLTESIDNEHQNKPPSEHNHNWNTSTFDDGTFNLLFYLLY